MTSPKSIPATAAMNSETTTQANTKPEADDELSGQQLDKVSGGIIRRVRGGDDDLDDLEVERLR